MEKGINGFPLISVIVPVYNVNQYLERCLESIISQTYHNLEILLVDDGSIDGSGETCDKYALKDMRIKVIHKENGGLSSARNAAIDILTGTYITCVDSDDYVTEDYVEYLYNLLQHNHADISMCQLKKIYSDKDKLDAVPIMTEVLNGKDAIKYYLYQKKFTASAHCKMYKCELFHSLQYPVGKYHEDMAIICQLLDLSSRIVISNQQKYYYVQREDSIMGEKFNSKKMHRIEIAEEIRSFIKKNHPDLIKAANDRCFLAAIQTFRELPLERNYHSYLDIIWKEIVRYRKKVITDADAKVSHKVMALSTYGGKHFLNILGICYTHINQQ